MRTIIGCLAVAALVAGCGEPRTPISATPHETELRVHQSPSPFQEVTAGQVRAVIPDGWHPSLAGSFEDPQEGFVASPRPDAWWGERGPVEGIAAVWVDGTRVGVPSDYYYLAATGPALSMITGAGGCSATRQRVYADHLPSFAEGAPGSPGDFIARGQGTCTVGRTPTRWAYFVAAPGYGPARGVGIPSSGLYLVVALLPDSPRAPALLDRLLLRTEFGGATMADFIAAARAETA